MANDRQKVIDLLNDLYRNRVLTSLQFSAITQYIDALEGQVSGYSRALQRAQAGDDKYWLEYRTDPESRRNRVEFSGYGKCFEAKTAADAYLPLHPGHKLWICARDIEIPYPDGANYADQLIKKEGV